MTDIGSNRGGYKERILSAGSRELNVAMFPGTHISVCRNGD